MAKHSVTDGKPVDAASKPCHAARWNSIDAGVPTTRTSTSILHQLNMAVAGNTLIVSGPDVYGVVRLGKYSIRCDNFPLNTRYREARLAFLVTPISLCRRVPEIDPCTRQGAQFFRLVQCASSRRTIVRGSKGPDPFHRYAPGVGRFSNVNSLRSDISVGDIGSSLGQAIRATEVIAQGGQRQWCRTKR